MGSRPRLISQNEIRLEKLRFSLRLRLAASPVDPSGEELVAVAGSNLRSTSRDAIEAPRRDSGASICRRTMGGEDPLICAGMYELCSAAVGDDASTHPGEANRCMRVAVFTPVVGGQLGFTVLGGAVSSFVDPLRGADPALEAASLDSVSQLGLLCHFFQQRAFVSYFTNCPVL